MKAGMPEADAQGYQQGVQVVYSTAAVGYSSKAVLIECKTHSLAVSCKRCCQAQSPDDSRMVECLC